MSVFAKFMFRRGWIQLSRYGLRVDEHGVLHGLPPAGQALLPKAAARVPLALPAPALSPAPPVKPRRSLPTQAVAAPPQPVDVAVDDDQVWQAAVARAKAQEESQLAMADTAKPATAVLVAPCAERDPDTIMDASEPSRDDDDENWEALIAAANQRAESCGEAMSQTPELAREEATVIVSAPAVVGAQVEQGTIPANDDKPAHLVTSIHHKRLVPPSVAVGISKPASEEENWNMLRADAENKAQAEAQRKLRAMREVQRPQNNSYAPTAGANRRRLASGTRNVPHASPVVASAHASGKRTLPDDQQTVDESTKVDMPRTARSFS